MITIALVQKLLFLAAVIFMGIGFYTALAGGYASDYGVKDDSQEQKKQNDHLYNYTNIVGYMLNCEFESLCLSDRYSILFIFIKIKT
ncbi:hypothetical protein M5F66_02330 [Acinetobacter sp. ANC 5033]|uniref:hypothetical protein n=1 Tax=Acinetobacter amyesii TaxID=2942470 RepID=UPI00201B8D86|nr:hypothetical protein [Acinetobacter amyesii]MCL6237192.1 hypothetical protein [Acinetobacter amyesii]